MTLLTTERVFWHCGAHTAKPTSAPRDHRNSADPLLPKSNGFWTPVRAVPQHVGLGDCLTMHTTLFSRGRSPHCHVCAWLAS